jgi:hypothetical protein
MPNESLHSVVPKIEIGGLAYLFAAAAIVGTDSLTRKIHIIYGENMASPGTAIVWDDEQG